MSGHGTPAHSHVMPIPVLIGTFVALMLLTGITVGAHYGIDIGAQGNLVIALVIATMKASLVLAFFMHLLYDKRYNFMIFATSVLGVVLFIAIAFLDADQTELDRELRQHDIEATQAAPAE